MKYQGFVEKNKLKEKVLEYGPSNNCLFCTIGIELAFSNIQKVLRNRNLHSEMNTAN